MKAITKSTYHFYRNAVNPNTKAARFISVYIAHHEEGRISDREFITRCNAVSGEKVGAPIEYSDVRSIAEVA